MHQNGICCVSVGVEKSLNLVIIHFGQASIHLHDFSQLNVSNGFCIEKCHGGGHYSRQNVGPAPPCYLIDVYAPPSNPFQCEHVYVVRHNTCLLSPPPIHLNFLDTHTNPLFIQTWCTLAHCLLAKP